MAITATFTDPTKIIDGVSTPISIDTWAQETLSAEEFITFTQAHTRQRAIWANAASAGNVTITRNNPHSRTITFNSDVEQDAEYLTFQERYMADSTLTWDSSYGQ